MIKKFTKAKAPQARLFTAPGCPHCSGVKRSLEQLLDESIIAALEIIDISQQPELAEAVGVRSVPWLEMGLLTFTGEQQPRELRKWAERLAEPEAIVDYYEKQLADGELSIAEQVLQKSPQTLASLLKLIVRDDLPLQVRIGTVALFEGFTGKAQLQALIPELTLLLAHKDYRIRVDVAHLLQLSESPMAIPPLNTLLKDENPEVREIAAEAIEELTNYSEDTSSR